MKLQRSSICFLVLALGIVNSSCTKYLEKKPDKKLATPSSITDLQLVLDNYRSMNSQYPPASEIMSDNYYLLSDDWSSLSNESQRDLYIWKKTDNTLDYWSAPYKAVFYANVVLDNLANMEPGMENGADYENVRGSALFFRAYYFYALAQIFAPPYHSSTASADLGIPLRLSSDYNEISRRSTVRETYDRIISDFKESAALLPVHPLVKSRPGKPAAYGALARAFLAMKQYDQAGLYADSCLRLYDSLMDYNTLNPDAVAPIPRFNKEVIFQMKSLSYTILGPSRAKVDSTLFRSYSENDLRKTLWFKERGNGAYVFRGDYDGSGNNSGYVFGGIVTDEMYLIRAESYARAGKAGPALKDLNRLLMHRWKSGTFVPVTAPDAQAALDTILGERRKELIYRGTRWTDLRRLKDDPAYFVTPVRVVNNERTDLPPGSPRYTMLIPVDVIKTTGMKQNQ